MVSTASVELETAINAYEFMALINSAALLAVSSKWLPNKYTVDFTASHHPLAAVLNSKWPGTDCVSGTTSSAAGGFVMLGLDHWCVVSMTRTAGMAAQTCVRHSQGHSITQQDH